MTEVALQSPFEPLRQFYKSIYPAFSEEGWHLTEQLAAIRTLKKGEILLKQGAVCTNVSFIVEGLVRMYIEHDDKEKTLCFFNELTYVSDYSSFLTRQPSKMYIQALEPTTVIETSYDNLQRLYREVPEANLLGRIMCEQLFIQTNDVHVHELKENFEQRYLTLVEKYPWIISRVPQYMIASFMGITPEALSRIKARIARPSKNKRVA